LTSAKIRAKIVYREGHRTMAASITQMPTTQFPVDKEIELKIKVRISSQEDQEYFFSDDGKLQAGFLADIYDMLDMINKHIIDVNGFSYRDLQKIISE